MLRSSCVNNSAGLELNWVLEKRGRGCALIVAIACSSLLQYRLASVMALITEVFISCVPAKAAVTHWPLQELLSGSVLTLQNLIFS